MPHWKDAFPVDLAEEGRFSRREFTRFLAVVSVGFTVGIGYLKLRGKRLEGAPEPRGTEPLDLALVEPGDLPPGKALLFTYRDPQDRCILIHTPGGDFKAYRQTCTHLGCAVRWDGARLECPCHKGYFEVDRGFPVQGPPTRPLSALAVEVRDNVVHILGDLPKPTGGAA